MVHGDVKAANVMVSPEGIAIIADFGNARLKELTMQFTGTTVRAVSLRWAAPELLMGEHCKQNVHSDIYAFGMTALETLTGEIPFKDLNDTQLTFRLLGGVAKPSRPANVSNDVWMILESCWAREPQARPSLATVMQGLSNRTLQQGQYSEQGSLEDINIKHERASSDAEGIERFQVFDKRIRSLDLKLQAFANAVRQLGSNVGLLSAAYRLRARLGQIQYFFRENAAELFDAVPHAPNDGTWPYNGQKRGKVGRHMTVGPANTKPRSIEIEGLPDEMEQLAEDLDAFLKRLNDVPEFTDEAVNLSIMAFEGDLRYRASCLREFEGQLKYVAVAHYINDLTKDLGVHMESMMDSLNTLIDVGVPTIHFSQKHTAAGLQNLSVLATFFSGMTVTTLQISFEAYDGASRNLLNGLWISSLVFSITSAINSQLVYHWCAATYRSPRRYVPWWVLIWITRTPLFFLAGSMIAFLAGLCVMIYNSPQGRVLSGVVTSPTVATSCALLCVGLWFASERWPIARTKGSRWLLDILEGYGERAGKAGFTPMKEVAKQGVQRTQTLLKLVNWSLTSVPEHVVVIAGRIRLAMDVIKSVPRGFPQTVSSSAIVTDETSIDARGDGESQDGTFRTDSPTAMFNGDNSSGNLGINPQSEKLKLSDRGGSNKELIPENEPLSLDTKINPPSGVPTTLGSSSSTSADVDPSEQPQPNAKLGVLTKRASVSKHSLGPSFTPKFF
ncbi:hypothetical protein FRC11_004834 [Ceratobasidium sp. 423]|nr:hypothetical protein FRC11_004834 [Ceratobasidium sp. 423]